MTSPTPETRQDASDTLIMAKHIEDLYQKVLNLSELVSSLATAHKTLQEQFIEYLKEQRS